MTRSCILHATTCRSSINATIHAVSSSAVLFSRKAKQITFLPAATKNCGQSIWLKLGTEVGCDEIFQKPLWLPSLTFSFGVTGGSHFWPFEHQKSSLPGAILKVTYDLTGKLCYQMNLSMKYTVIELSLHPCNFVFKVLHREEPVTGVWPELLLQLQLKIAIFQNFSIFTCLPA